MRSFLTSACLLAAVTNAAFASILFEEQSPKVVYDQITSRDLGPKRAGALCLPSGSVSWSDIGPSEPESPTSILRSLLADRPTSPISVVEIVHLRVSACSKKYLFGQTGMISGTGEITLAWTIAGRAEPLVTRTKFEFTKHARGSAGLFHAALRAGLVAFDRQNGTDTLPAPED